MGTIPAWQADALRQEFFDAFMAIFPPPPVRGLGTTGGFKLQIEDRTDKGYEALNENLQQVLGKAWQTPELSGCFERRDKKYIYFESVFHFFVFKIHL